MKVLKMFHKFTQFIERGFRISDSEDGRETKSQAQQTECQPENPQTRYVFDQCLLETLKMKTEIASFFIESVTVVC